MKIKSKQNVTQQHPARLKLIKPKIIFKWKKKKLKYRRGGAQRRKTMNINGGALSIWTIYLPPM